MNITWITNIIKSYAKKSIYKSKFFIDQNREFQSLQECGLPNITGQWNSNGGGVISMTAKGAYKHLADSYYNIQPTSNQWGSVFGFDASRCSAIYKNNHREVTPYNFNVNLLVKI